MCGGGSKGYSSCGGALILQLTQGGRAVHIPDSAELVNKQSTSKWFPFCVIGLEDGTGTGTLSGKAGGEKCGQLLWWGPGLGMGMACPVQRNLTLFKEWADADISAPVRVTSNVVALLRNRSKTTRHLQAAEKYVLDTSLICD